MKKILLMMVAVLSLSMIFTSCKKDGKALDSLVGTTWTCITDGATERETDNITFDGATSFSEVIITVDKKTNKETKSQVKGSYTYEAPVVKINYNGLKVSAEVKGNTLVVTLLGIEQVFTKQ